MFATPTVPDGVVKEIWVSLCTVKLVAALPATGCWRYR
jgi:hypothetical protein